MIPFPHLGIPSFRVNHPRNKAKIMMNTSILKPEFFIPDLLENFKKNKVSRGSQ